MSAGCCANQAKSFHDRRRRRKMCRHAFPPEWLVSICTYPASHTRPTAYLPNFVSHSARKCNNFKTIIIKLTEHTISRSVFLSFLKLCEGVGRAAQLSIALIGQLKLSPSCPAAFSDFYAQCRPRRHLVGSWCLHASVGQCVSLEVWSGSVP